VGEYRRHKTKVVCFFVLSVSPRDHRLLELENSRRDTKPDEKKKKEKSACFLVSFFFLLVFLESLASSDGGG
jgi:hypothetical protein